jgi:hypothetical protein
MSSPLDAPERPRQDVSGPEGEDRIEPERMVGERDHGDHAGEEQRGVGVADVQPLGRQIPRCGAQREGEENGHTNRRRSPPARR